MRFLTFIIFLLLPQLSLAEGKNHAAIGQANVERMAEILACAAPQRAGDRAFGGGFSAEFRSPRNASLLGLVRRDAGVATWEVIIEFVGADVIAFDSYSGLPHEGEVAPIFERVQAPQEMLEGLVRCGVEWFGHWAPEPPGPPAIRDLLPPLR